MHGPLQDPFNPYQPALKHHVHGVQFTIFILFNFLFNCFGKPLSTHTTEKQMFTEKPECVIVPPLWTGRKLTVQRHTDAHILYLPSNLPSSS